MTSAEMDAFDEMRLLARETAAHTRATGNILDDVVDTDDSDSRKRLEELAHPLGAAVEAADAKVEAGFELARDLGNNSRRQDA